MASAAPAWCSILLRHRQQTAPLLAEYEVQAGEICLQVRGLGLASRQP